MKSPELYQQERLCPSSNAATQLTQAHNSGLCAFFEPCCTQPLKQTPERVLRFSQQEVDLALRRQRSAEARASGQNLRSAVEATVRSIKHPFGNGKVPVRGQPRVSMVVIGSAAMSNARRIHRYLIEQGKAERATEAEKREQRVAGNEQQVPGDSLFASFFTRLKSFPRSVNLFRPALAHRV